MAKQRFLYWLLLVVLITIFAYPHSVQADIAPPKAPAGSNIDSGEESTNVQMVAETVTIEIPSTSKHETGQATVTAVFQMRNLGDIEERMDVRFPLCGADSEFSETLDMQGYYYVFPPVENFKVWVDGSSPPITTTYESLSRGGGEERLDFPCWANFPVIFPPEKEVTIKVQYIQVAGYGEIYHGTVNFVTLSYVLFTGAGWKDTIGSADITAYFPVEVENLNVYKEPREATVSGKKIHWHFEDFEPDPKSESGPGRVEITFLQPKYWYKVEETRAKVQVEPNNGEAWGQFGKALKEAYRFEHRFAREEFYWESYDAYEKAVTLLPNDAEWHYGFANLACNNAMNYEPYVRSISDPLEQCRTCLEQMEQTLKINPNHERAFEMLERLQYRSWVDLSGAEPIYLILTPSTPTRTPQPVKMKSLTRTIQPALTITPTETSLTTPVWATTPAPTIVAPAKPEQKPSACAAIVLPLFAVALLLFHRYRW